MNRIARERRRWRWVLARSRKLEPLSLLEASLAFAAPFKPTRQVALTDVGPINVSTVWLVVDHAHGWGRPKVFETMAFYQGDPVRLDGREVQVRYTYEREARIGHRAVCHAMRGLLGRADELFQKTCCAHETRGAT